MHTRPETLRRLLARLGLEVLPGRSGVAVAAAQLTEHPDSEAPGPSAAPPGMPPVSAHHLPSRLAHAQRLRDEGKVLDRAPSSKPPTVPDRL